MDGGAWPFVVGGVICLVNSDNERDSGLLNSADGAVALRGTWPSVMLKLLRRTSDA